MSFLGGLLKKAARVDPTPSDPEFLRWFKKSVVAKYDGQGRLEGPVRVFHGSRNIFDVFEAPYRPDGRQVWNAFGSWFSEDEVYARYFTQKPEQIETGIIYPVYLSIQSPMRLKGSGPNGWQGLVDLYEQVTGLKTYNATKTSNEKFRKHLKSLGYDGIVLSEFGGDANISPYEQNFYIVFEPSQVKHVFNSGSWDSRSPNMFEGIARRRWR